ncbi:MAG: hypothetical protein AAF226_13095 [Verrucomicrobiota bacterium]
MSRPFFAIVVGCGLALMSSHADDLGRALFTAPSSDGRVVLAQASGKWAKTVYKGESVVQLSGEPVVYSRAELGPRLNDQSVGISAMIMGGSYSRLHPRMGVAVLGRNGFHLRVAAGSEELELVYDGEVLGAVPFKWNPGAWQKIELIAFELEGQWQLEGRCWNREAPRPNDPTIVHQIDDSEIRLPLVGKCSLTGSPYNGLPILYGGVRVFALN